MSYKIEERTCPECGEKFLRSVYCHETHLCKKYMPYHDLVHIHHLRTEVKRLKEAAVIPNQNEAWNIGYDLSASDDWRVPAHGTANVPTGISMSVPLGFYYTIEPRSSLAIKGVFPIGGIIDATYIGEIFVMLINVTDQDYIIYRGDRVAQAIFHRGLLADITEVPEFSKEYNLRGTKGFGSSGR